MQIYGIKTCDTCRKALKSLPDATFVDVRADGMPDDVLKSAYGRFENALINNRSTTWRGLSETDRVRPALDLLNEFPTLMKRPLIVTDEKMYLGWGKDVQAELLG